jgi:hypothetical protein
LVNGIIKPNSIELILKESSPRVKIIKLHGDLFYRYMAWTEEEINDFLKSIRKPLSPTLYGRDILIVGYSFSDKAVREFIIKAGGIHSSIWYFHPVKVPDSLASNERVRAVVSEDCKFETLFTKLTEELKPLANVSPRPIKSQVRQSRKIKAVQLMIY